MAGTPGAFTTDDIPTSQLYTEFMDSVERHNEQDRNFRALLCDPDYTKKSTIRISYRGKEFEVMGSDTDRPDFQHQPSRDVTLSAPVRLALNESITQTAWEKGLSSQTLRSDHEDTLRADASLITQACLKPCLTDGGWYDATLDPPDYRMDTFTSSHDHYVASAAGGTPALSMFVDDKRHIEHHGYKGSITTFMNGANTANIESIPEWSTYTGPPTPVINTLQRLGLTPSFMAAGVPVVEEDWIPEDYMLTVDLDANPLKWRVTESDMPTDELIVFTESEQGSTPNVIWHYIQDYVRWVSATVYVPGAGVARYLGGASWTDTTGWISDLP